MPTFELLELLLMSGTDRSAKRIKFHPHRTIILGGNDTGKSSIIKSIYETFGAPPAVVHPNWRELDVTSVVRFRLHESEYSILRKGKFFGIFDADDKLIQTFDSITRGLGPYLGKLFGFQLRMNTRDGKVITPPPAYFFLPYYIDQDAGWNKNLASFARLQQLPNWRKSVIEYHVGLKPDEYYRLRSEAEVIREQIRVAGSELRVLEGVATTIREEIGAPTPGVDLEAFRTQVGELLGEIRQLQSSEEQLKLRLVALHNQHVSLGAQLDIARRAWHEVHQDFVFATDELVEAVVHCPTCGAGYDNSFSERFQIADDENQIAELIISLESERNDIDTQIKDVNQQFSTVRVQLTKLRELLETRQQEVTLADVIQSEGRREVYDLFRAKIHAAQTSIREHDIARATILNRMERFTDKERRSAILSTFRGTMRRHLFKLGVTSMPESRYRTPDALISETGSRFPRSLLAYYVSLWTTIREHSTSVFCPLVIDSPNQGAQDRGNIKAMLELLRDTQPEDTQMVLAVEQQFGVNIPGRVERVEHRYRLLRPEEYEAVESRVTPLLRSALGTFV